MLIDQQQGVVVLAKGIGADVADQERHVLAKTFGLGVGGQVMAFCSKAYAKQGARLRRIGPHNPRQNVFVFSKRQRRRFAGSVFFDFLCGWRCWAPIGHRCGRYENSSCSRTIHNGCKHILCRFHINARDTARRGQADRAGHQRHGRAGLAGGACYREAHFSARQVRNAPHGINGLIGGAGSDQHLLTRQRFRREEGNDVFEQLIGLQHAAVAGLAAGLKAGAHTQHRGAIGRQLPEIALRRRMRVHLAVHGRRDQEGHLVDGPCQAHQTEQVISAPMQQFGHEVGATGCD